MILNPKDGKLYVTYRKRLVTLLREVKLLIDFPIPAKILHVAYVGEKFKCYGVALEKVSIFNCFHAF